MLYSTHLLRHLRQVIGQNIHALRVHRKITLRKLARLTGVPEHLLDHYELGKNEIGLSDLLKISCVLEVGIDDLIEENFIVSQKERS
jgi:transcriptional regulator with XRE-family HTH domain